MRKYLRVIIIVLFVMCGRNVIAQTTSQPAPPATAMISPALDKLFCKVLIVMEDGRQVLGLLLGLEGDTLVLRLGNNKENIPLNNMAEVSMETETNLGLHF
jgi:hypothetical protein